MAAAQDNDNDRTRSLLQQATDVDPRNENAWQWRAELAESPLDACQAWEQVLAINPKHMQAQNSIGPVRLKAGIAAAKQKDVPVAHRLLTAAVKDDPQSEYGWLWLASVTDSPREALKYLRKVLEINPANAAAKKGIEYYNAKIEKLDGPRLGPTATPAPTISFNEPLATHATASGRMRIPEPGNSKRRVLVVDISRTIRKLVGITLSMDGYRAEEAADLLEAADRIREKGVPDLFVFDINAGGADVYEFCELLRQNPDAKDVPIILLTGKDGQYDRFRARVAGIDLFLPKPLQPERLLRTVRSNLNQPIATV